MIETYKTIWGMLPDTLQTFLFGIGVAIALLIVLNILVWGFYGMLLLFFKGKLKEGDPIDMFMGGRNTEGTK